MIVDIVFGFLGSGKTTFILKTLERWGAEEKIVVLVNEFGEVGIDGDLVTLQGGNVVEMPSGCICCTLQSDFRSQILDISRTIRPQRVIIEPTGVATIAQVHAIIKAQMFEDAIERINNILVADATGFMALYKANRHFVESQVENAQLALLNKCDLVEKKKAMVIRSAISAIHPDLPVLMTEFGAVDWGEYRIALDTVPGSDLLPGKGAAAAFSDDLHSFPHEGKGRELHFHENEDALGYESFGAQYDRERFDHKELESFFQDLNRSDSTMGEIVRAKGIFRVAEGSVLMELASGEFSSQPIRKSEKSKISIIGSALNRDLIRAAVERCLTEQIP